VWGKNAMATTLQVVRDAIESNSRVKFDPIEVYIIGFAAGYQAYPWRFLNRGCTAMKEDRYLSSKSIVGPFKYQLHNSFADMTWAFMYGLICFFVIPSWA
jgi:hypothetical protein